MVSYRSDPLPGQQIRSVSYLKETDELFCGATMHADCQSCPPSSDRCCLARVSAVRVQVVERVLAPPGAQEAHVVGKLAKNKWLCAFYRPEGMRWTILSTGSSRTPLPTTAKKISNINTEISRWFNQELLNEPFFYSSWKWEERS